MLNARQNHLKSLKKYKENLQDSKESSKVQDSTSSSNSGLQKRVSLKTSPLNRAIGSKEKTKTKSLLPRIPSDKKYTIVLDLDETLVHFKENEGKDG